MTSRSDTAVAVKQLCAQRMQSADDYDRCQALILVHLAKKNPGLISQTGVFK